MTTYHSFFKCFMTYNMPSSMEKHCESTKTTKSPDGQNVFLSSSSSSDGLVQNCMTLSQWFLHKQQHQVYNQILHIFNSEKICRVELCTELFYAIIPTLLFAGQLSLHLVTSSTFFFKSCIKILP